MGGPGPAGTVFVVCRDQQTIYQLSLQDGRTLTQLSLLPKVTDPYCIGMHDDTLYVVHKRTLNTEISWAISKYRFK